MTATNILFSWWRPRREVQVTRQTIGISGEAFHLIMDHLQGHKAAPRNHKSSFVFGQTAAQGTLTVADDGPVPARRCPVETHSGASNTRERGRSEQGVGAGAR